VDEVKDVPSIVQRSGQFIFLNGVAIPADSLVTVERQFSTVMEFTQSNVFHAKDSYKEKSPNLPLMNAMTKIVSSFHLHWFCFPFAKNWLENPRLHVIRSMRFNSWQPKVSNYEFVAFYLFLHCLNTHLSAQTQLEPHFRLICEQGIMDARQGFSFEESTTLNTIENVNFASRKQAPLLALPDHLGYIFGKCRRDLVRQNGRIDLEPNEGNTIVQNECLRHITCLANGGLFHRFDLWEWIDHENKRVDKVEKNVASGA
jgi:hypothetical protein